jgi:serine/threonine protein kinase/alpha-tubulin suppressor-like RCC1 family protein
MSNDRVSPGLSALEPAYEIIREIGRGGTSVVYLARERASDSEVAVKLIRAKYISDEEALGRFAREARFLERLVHPNIVRVRAVLELGDAGLAIVMSHVPGRTLKELIRAEGRLTPERTERFTRDIARALGAAHSMGIVHRDVKPENVFVDADDRPLLADFGLARSMTGDSQLTMAGVAIGTPAYMPPEQIEGAPLDARGDVYSLGLVAWEMLSGHRPWEGESLYAVLYHQRYEQLPDVRDLRDDVPDVLADTIMVAIEKHPSARWQSASQMIEALDGAAPPRRGPRRAPVASSDTVRFTRPSAGTLKPDSLLTEPLSPSPATASPAVTPAKAVVPFVELGPAAVPANRAAREESFSPTTFTALAAELDAQDEVPAPRTRRRYLIAAGGLAALATIGLVAANVQGRANDAHRTPALVPRDFKINDSAGKALPATSAPTSADSDSSALTTPQVAPAATVASSQPAPPQLPEKRTSPPPAHLPNVQPAEAANSGGTTAETKPSDKKTTTTAGDAMPDKSAKPTAKTPAKSDKPTSEPTQQAVAPTPAPPAPAPAPTVVSSRGTVAAGGLHSCMLNSDGRAYCWGGNNRGQLGAGSANSVATPLAVSGGVRFTTIATGLSHSCGITRDGGVWCWGENERGQLGDRTTLERQSPTHIADQRMFTTVAAGAAHTCALDSQGGAWCWGANAHGQLGLDGSSDIGAPTLVPGDHRFASISVGWNFSCGLDTGGRAFCWGENGNGQLGDGSTNDHHAPTPVAGGMAFRSIATGATHACGITANGEAYCWGNNAGGQLGDGTRSSHALPTQVKTSLHFVAIAAGALHTCALTADGVAFCWGRDNFGQLGAGAIGEDSPEPVRVSGDHAFASVHAFGSHTCATTTSGDLFCWGYNLDGQLGDGSRVNRARPAYIEPPG